ncbi:MAG: hypothetical protein ABI867_24415 [Kofleriaceae bacterium]
MQHRLLIATAVSLLGISAEAHAELEWVLGTTDQNEHFCGASQSSSPFLKAFAAYVRDPAQNVLLPSTGDTAYVAAVAFNISACADNTSDATRLYINLPAGAELAISPQLPVTCTRYFDSRFPQPVDPITCRQAPNFVADRGWYVGDQDVRPGETFEVRVPVRFMRRLDVADAAAKLTMTATSTGTRFLTPSVPVAVAYRPEFANHAVTSVTAFSANVKFDLTHYFEYGVVDVAYGTDENNLAWGTLTTTTNPNVLAHANSTATLTGLSAGTRWYWRVRITTAVGTKLGPMQSFETPPATMCRRFGCR